MGLHPQARIDDYRAKGYWNDDLIDALFAERVRSDPDTLAIIDPLNRSDLVDGPFRQLTWTELDDLVNRIAQVLLDEGVGPGVTVGVQLPNTVEIAATFLAIVRLGAIVVPFPVQYRSHELTELSKVAALKVFVTTTRIGRREAAVEMASLQPNIPTLERVLAFGSNVPEGVVDLDGRVAAAVDRSGLEAFNSSFVPDQNDCVTICWTSGTESTPKGVPRTHYDWLAMSWTTVEGPQLTKDDVLLNPFPMVNMAGINGMFLPWLRVGGVLVQHHPFDLATFLAQVAKHGATYTVAPPARRHSPLRSCRAGMTSTASRSSTSTARTRASPCSGDPSTCPTPQSAPCTSPATGHRGGRGRTAWPNGCWSSWSTRSQAR
jgi:acyl-CoA synthetase